MKNLMIIAFVSALLSGCVVYDEPNRVPPPPRRAPKTVVVKQQVPPPRPQRTVVVKQQVPPPKTQVKPARPHHDGRSSKPVVAPKSRVQSVPAGPRR